MKMKLMTYMVLLVLLGSVQIPAKEMQPLSREDDLNIMKGVLQKLLDQKTTGVLPGDRIDAFYLDNFGAVFRVIYATNQQVVLTEALQNKLSQIQMQKQKIGQDMLEIQKKHQALRDQMNQTRQNMTARVVRQNAADAVHLYQDEENIHMILDTLKTLGGEGLNREEAMDQIQKRLMIFFERYVAAMQDLKPEDRVAVLVEVKDWGQMNQENAFLYGWVRFDDVTRFRENHLTKQQYAEKVVFQSYNNQTEVARDISIMSEILSRGMKTNNYFTHDANQGLYLNGYGALLFLSVPLNAYETSDNNSDFASMFYGQANGEGLMYQTDKTLETAQAQMALLRQKVLGLMGSYGHTLRLDPKEWVSLYVNTGSPYLMWDQDSMPAGLIIQVRQQDLNRYHSGQIDLKALENLAKIKTL